MNRRRDEQSQKLMHPGSGFIFCFDFFCFSLFLQLPSLLHFSSLISHHLTFHFCLFSSSPSLSLSLALSVTPDSVECRSPCLEAPLFLSLTHSLSPFFSFHCFLPLFLLHWGCGFAGLCAGCWTAPLAGYRCFGYDLYCIWRLLNLHNH